MGEHCTFDMVLTYKAGNELIHLNNYKKNKRLKTWRDSSPKKKEIDTDLWKSVILLIFIEMPNENGQWDAILSPWEWPIILLNWKNVDEDVEKKITLLHFWYEDIILHSLYKVMERDLRMTVNIKIIYTTHNNTPKCIFIQIWKHKRVYIFAPYFHSSIICNIHIMEAT